MTPQSSQNSTGPAPTFSVRGTFLSSIFFVLGFSSVFSLLGVLLQTILSSASYTVQEWLGRIGGAVIILFGLFLLRLVRIPFLEREHKVRVSGHFASRHLTSFVFGAAFAAGWTPCVSVALGAILALAATDASSAFLLLFSYTLGIGAPFLLVGAFAERAQALVERAGRGLTYVQYIFGAVLVLLGVLIFVGQLGRIASWGALGSILESLNLVSASGGGIASLSVVNMAVAFAAGLGSFLSPCVLPLVPGFLSYLAGTGSANVSKGRP